MNRTLTIVVVGLAALMILLLAVVFILLLQDTLSPSADANPTLVPSLEPEGTAVSEVTELPPPAVDVPSTFTPLPTSTPTNTPEATATPVGTNTPLPTNTLPPPTPTNTPVPIPPTSTPVPAPPTATPVPQPTAPTGARGLTATHFALQPRSNYSVGGQIWFEFTIANSTGGDVAYNRLGVMPRKGGTDRGDWFQQSYGGPNATIKPVGLSHEDNIKLPEAGNYTLRLAICFDGWDACNAGGGTWVTMSEEIPITVN